jgi:hypothetical protein
MKAASLKELKAELSTLPPAQLIEVCMHLIKYKKENKELLTYLLFEAGDERSYIKKVELIIDALFDEMNRSSVYLMKKTLRKILRTTNKFIKYSGSKETEVELLIYFCRMIRSESIPVESSTTLTNLYQRQLQRIQKAMSLLHEDLQYDYSKELETFL